MNPNFFPRVEHWRLPNAAFAASLEEMARDGQRGNEGIALWLGARLSGVATVTHVLCVRGADVTKEPAYLNVGAATMNDVGDFAIEHGLTFVGQIHSHGPRHGVDLSPTDRRYGVSVPYFLSVVAPDYALRQGTHFDECGVHIFESGLGYRRLGQPEVAARIVLVDEPVTVSELGG